VANGLLVRFGPNTVEGTVVEARLYEITDGVDINPVSDNPGDLVTLYTVGAGDIPADIESSFEIWIEFDDTYDLFTDAEATYFVAVLSEQANSTELTVVSQSASDNDNSTRVIALSGDQEELWFGDTGTPAVRLTMDEDPEEIPTAVGLSEYDELDLNMGIAPNPVTDIATLAFSLDQSMDLQIRIHDAQGRLVYNRDLGTMPAGSHVMDIDASAFAGGVYTYSLVSGTSKTSKSMIVR